MQKRPRTRQLATHAQQKPQRTRQRCYWDFFVFSWKTAAFELNVFLDKAWLKQRCMPDPPASLISSNCCFVPDILWFPSSGLPLFTWNYFPGFAGTCLSAKICTFYKYAAIYLRNLTAIVELRGECDLTSWNKYNKTGVWGSSPRTFLKLHLIFPVLEEQVIFDNWHTWSCT